MPAPDNDALPSLKEFFRSFLHSFLKHFILFILLFAFLVIASRDFDAHKIMSKDIYIFLPTIPLIIFTSYCVGWAGAIHKCIPHSVMEIIIFGAILVSVISGLMFIGWSVLISPLPTSFIIFWTIVIFIFSWLEIALAFSLLGFFGQFWW